MLTYSRICEIIDEIKFLDWKFEVHPGMHPATITIFLVDRVQDSFSSEPKITNIITQNDIKYPSGEEEFIEFIFAIVVNRLKHEASELFYVKGELPYNEHDKRTSSEVIASIYPKEAFV